MMGSCPSSTVLLSPLLPPVDDLGPDESATTTEPCSAPPTNDGWPRRSRRGAPLGRGSPTAPMSPAMPNSLREGERARHHFIEANVRLVQSIANRFSVPAHLDREDIVQDGMIGLEKAVEKYDWRRGYKFSTYATWWIRQSIQRGLEASATTIRIPGHRTRELRSAVASSTATGGRLDDELAMIDMLSQPESMDRPIGDGPDTLGTLVASDDEGPDEAAERNVARERIDALLDHLDDTSAFAVAARFGLRGHEPATFAVIAQQLGVTPQAVRRRVERAIAKLRTHAEPIAA